MPAANGEFSRGRVNIVSLASVGFLTLSLVGLLSFTNNPLKQVFVDSLAGKKSCEDYGSPAKRQKCRMATGVSSTGKKSDIYNTSVQNTQKQSVLEYAASANPTADQDKAIVQLCQSSGGTDCSVNARQWALSQLSADNQTSANQNYQNQYNNNQVFKYASSANPSSDLDQFVVQLCQSSGGKDCSVNARDWALKQLTPENQTAADKNYQEQKDVSSTLYGLQTEKDPATRTKLLGNLQSYANQGTISQDTYNKVSSSFITSSDYQNCLKQNTPAECATVNQNLGQVKLTTDQGRATAIVSELQYGGDKDKLLAELKGLADKGAVSQDYYDQINTIFNTPVTSIAITPEGSVSIKQALGSTCSFNSACQSNYCGSSGKCEDSKFSTSVTTVTIQSCVNSGGQWDFGSNSCQTTQEAQNKLSQAKQSCTTSGGGWNSYMSRCESNPYQASSLLNTLTFGGINQMTQTAADINSLNTQYNPNGQLIVSPGGFNNSSANLQLLTSEANTAARFAATDIAAGALGGAGIVELTGSGLAGAFPAIGATALGPIGQTIGTGISAGFAGYITYGALSGPNSQAYQNAQAMLFTSYLAAPESVTQMFRTAVPTEFQPTVTLTNEQIAAGASQNLSRELFPMASGVSPETPITPPEGPQSQLQKAGDWIRSQLNPPLGIVPTQVANFLNIGVAEPTIIAGQQQAINSASDLLSLPQTESVLANTGVGASGSLVNQLFPGAIVSTTTTTAYSAVSSIPNVASQLIGPLALIGQTINTGASSNYTSQTNSNTTLADLNSFAVNFAQNPSTNIQPEIVSPDVQITITPKIDLQPIQQWVEGTFAFIGIKGQGRTGTPVQITATLPAISTEPLTPQISNIADQTQTIIDQAGGSVSSPNITPIQRVQLADLETQIDDEIKKAHPEFTQAQIDQYKTDHNITQLLNPPSNANETQIQAWLANFEEFVKNNLATILNPQSADNQLKLKKVNLEAPYTYPDGASVYPIPGQQHVYFYVDPKGQTYVAETPEAQIPTPITIDGNFINSATVNPVESNSRVSIAGNQYTASVLGGNKLALYQIQLPSFIAQVWKDYTNWTSEHKNLAESATAPKDLTQVTTSLDGDPYISIQETYKSEQPALARRITDIENQLTNVDTQTVAKIVYNAKYTDGLTGLINKTGFTEGLDLEVIDANQNGTALTIITMDLQNFKSINDSFGHSAGDEALKTAADILKANSRSTDLATRPGGDEFIMILPQTDEDQAQELMQRILKDLAARKAVASSNDVVQKININYGIKRWTNTDTVDNYVKELDVAMYEQKRGAASPLGSIPLVQNIQIDTNILRQYLNQAEKYFADIPLVLQDFYVNNIRDSQGILFPKLFGAAREGLIAPPGEPLTNNQVPNIIFEQDYGGGPITLKINGRNYPVSSVSEAQTVIENVTGQPASINPANGVVTLTGQANISPPNILQKYVQDAASVVVESYNNINAFVENITSHLPSFGLFNPNQPVAVKPSINQILQTADEDVANDYQGITQRFRQNTIYPPGSAAIEPTTEAEKQILKFTKGVESVEDLPDFIHAVLSSTYAKNNLVTQIINSKTYGEASSILTDNEIPIRIVSDSELFPTVQAQAFLGEIWIKESALNDWPVLKQTVVHETTHIAIDDEIYKYIDELTGGIQNWDQYSQYSAAHARLSIEDMAYVNQARAAIHELETNPRLTDAEKQALQKSVDDAMKYYNWVVYGDVHPTISPNSSALQTAQNVGKNIINGARNTIQELMATTIELQFNLPYALGQTKVTRSIINTTVNLAILAANVTTPTPIRSVAQDLAGACANNQSCAAWVDNNLGKSLGLQNTPLAESQSSVQAPAPEISVSQKADGLALETAKNPPEIGIPMAPLGNITINHQPGGKPTFTIDVLRQLFDLYYAPSPASFMGFATNEGPTAGLATLLQTQSDMKQQMQRGYVLIGSGNYGFKEDYQYLLSSQKSSYYQTLADKNPDVNGQPNPITYDELNANQKRIYNFEETDLVAPDSQLGMTPEEALASGKYVGIIATKTVNDIGRRLLIYKYNPETAENTFMGVVLIGDAAKAPDWTGQNDVAGDVTELHFRTMPLGFEVSDGVHTGLPDKVKNGQSWAFDLPSSPDGGETKALYELLGGTGGGAVNIVAVDPDQLQGITIPQSSVPESVSAPAANPQPAGIISAPTLTESGSLPVQENLTTWQKIVNWWQKVNPFDKPTQPASTQIQENTAPESASKENVIPKTNIPLKDQIVAIKETNFGSNITPQFSSPTAANPYQYVPEWFWTKVFPKLNLTCADQAECLAKFNALPMADGNGEIQLTLNQDYKPGNLVNMNDYKIPVVTLIGSNTNNQLISKTTAPMVKKLMDDLNNANFGFGSIISYGYRSYDDQLAVRNEYGIKAGFPGQSMHQSGLAIDIFKTRPNGTINSNQPLDSENDAVQARILKILNDDGFVKPFPKTDRPHVVALDAVYPGLTKILIDAGIDPNDKTVIKEVLLGIAQTYEFQAGQGTVSAAVPQTQVAPGENFIDYKGYSQVDPFYNDKIPVGGAGKVSDTTCSVFALANLTQTDPVAEWQNIRQSTGINHIPQSGEPTEFVIAQLRAQGKNPILITGDNILDQIKEKTNAGIPVYLSAKKMKIPGVGVVGHHTMIIGVTDDGKLILIDSAYKDPKGVIIPLGYFDKGVWSAYIVYPSGSQANNISK